MQAPARFLPAAQIGLDIAEFRGGSADRECEPPTPRPESGAGRRKRRQSGCPPCEARPAPATPTRALEALAGGASLGTPWRVLQIDVRASWLLPSSCVLCILQRNRPILGLEERKEITMLYKSALVTSASGSVGGMTASHNKGGLYLRARTIPVNPNTEFQQVVRSAMRDLTARWVEVLTSSQREDWDIYGGLVPIPNALGDPVEQSGISAYTRSNIPRIQNVLPVVDDAPTTFTLGSFTDPSSLVVSEAAQTLAFEFGDSDAWVDEDDSSLLIQISRPQNQSINFFNGPYRITDSIDGSSTVPPTSPTTVPLSFAAVEGQRIFYRFRVSRADGRLSGTFLGNSDVVA